jgi:hypothetical protein
VCCRPNVLTCTYNSHRGAWDIAAVQEDRD